MDSDDAAPRFATIKKTKKTKSEMHAAAAAKKKRQRSGSESKSSAVQSEDPRERLAAFRASMFDIKQDETLSHSASADPEDTVLLAKWKAGKDGSAAKKRKTKGRGNDDDDDDVMPRIAIKATARRASSSSSSTAATSTTSKVKTSIAVSTTASLASSKSAAATSTVPIPGNAQSAPLKRKTAAATATELSNTTAAPVSAQQPPASTAHKLAKKKGKKNKLAKSSSAARGESDAPAALGAATNPVAKTMTATAAAGSVVTQDQLAMFNDVLSLDDPLETALQAAKAQAAATRHTGTKANGKTKVKTKGAAQPKMEAQVEKAEPAVAAKPKPQAATATSESAKSGATAMPKTEAVAQPEAAAKAKAKAKARKKQKQRKHSVDLVVAATSVHAAENTLSRAHPDGTASSVSTTDATSTPRKAALPVACAVEAARAASATATSTVTTRKAKKKKAMQRAKNAQQLAVASPDAASLPPTEQSQLSTPSASAAASAPAPASTLVPVPESTPAPAADEGKVAALEPKSEPVPAPTDAALKPERPQTRKSKQKELATASTGAPSGSETSTPPAARVQSSPTETRARIKRTRAAVETSESPSVLPEASVKPPSKRQRAEKLLQERRAVAQAAVAANEPVVRRNSANRKQLRAAESEDEDDESNKADSGDESGLDEELELSGPNGARGSDDDGAASDGSAAGASSYKQIFSDLIDEAARQQWELLEVGRLVKLFAGRWGHKKKKTARFLRRFCPELVNVDFLEGLGTALAPEHLVRIFERGSGTPVVFMNKLASAVENGDLTVRDNAFVEAVTKRAQRMPTNHDVLEFLLPLLESLSTVRDVSQLLKHVCADWHVERTAALVQQLLLTAVFDDLDGNQDEILRDLPQLKGKLDFPSRLDQEDADENGNLIGLIANDGSDLGEDSDASDDDEDALGEIPSDDDELHASDDDDDDDDEPYEGETDSEEERAVRALHRPKRRSRFILDEADEDSGREDEDAELETETEGDASDGGAVRRRRADVVSSESSSESESDSDDETWRSKPKTR